MIEETRHQQLIEYLDGTLPASEREEVEKLLTESAELREALQQLTEVSTRLKRSAEWNPSAALRESFNAALQQEIAAQHTTRVAFFSPTVYKVAAALVLAILAGGIGFWVNNQWREQQEITQLRNELNETKQLMLSLVNNQLSASQRMMGVSVANTVTAVDDEITHVLVKVLNEDSNTNVRLSALEALGRFSNEPHVKNALVQSLGTQKDPMVQIALIQLLVQIKEKTIVPQLENIIDNQQSIKAVKDEAHTALLKLS